MKLKQTEREDYQQARKTARKRDGEKEREK